MKKSKNIITLVLTLALMFTSLVAYPSIAKAASDYTSILHKTNTAFAGEPLNYTFSVSRESDLYFVLKMEYRTGIKLAVKDALVGDEIFSDSISTGDSGWNYQKKIGVFEITHTMHIPAGNYILEVVFDQDASFDMSMNQLAKTAKLIKSSMAITKGFTDTIKVSGGKIKSCSSSNTAIATVNNKGEITAKETGKANIKVKLTNGKTLTCKVTVEPNIYSAKSITVTDTLLNAYQMKAYKASFDKKGNLVVKFKIANNGSGRITSVRDFKIAITDSNKNTIATYKKTSFKADLNSYKDKSYSVTIPKSSLKKSAKNIDIRTAKIKITGSDANAQM